jgi:hypothetical protein
LGGSGAPGEFGEFGPFGPDFAIEQTFYRCTIDPPMTSLRFPGVQYAIFDPELGGPQRDSQESSGFAGGAEDTFGWPEHGLEFQIRVAKVSFSIN